jgi:hypothetical protein
MKVGDEILEVDGYTVGRFGGMSGDSITWRIVRSEGATIPIKVKRGRPGAGPRSDAAGSGDQMVAAPWVAADSDRTGRHAHDRESEAGFVGGAGGLAAQ